MMVGKTAVFAILTIFLMAASALGEKYSGGTGEPNNPYQIATPNDLNDIGNHPEDFNDCFIVVNDINMAGFTYTTALIAPDINNSSGHFQGTLFTGIFDGNGCIISNLTIDTAGEDNDFLGLFGKIEKPGQVKNLGIEDVNITGGYDSDCLGGLCGSSYWGTIYDCYATGFVSAEADSDSVGGLVGYNGYSSITTCHSSGTVAGYRNLGGLVGTNMGSVIECYSTAAITGHSCLGGLVGLNGGGVSNVSKCYSTGSVTCGIDSGCLGGLVGYNSGSISNCYSTGQVSGGDGSGALGGLVGNNSLFIFNSPGSISNCYSTGAVTGGNGSDNLAGLVGYNDKASISNSFWDTDTSLSNMCGDCYASGCDYCDGGSKCTSYGKSTAEMQTQSTFTDAGWDFVGETENGTEDIWRISEAVSYPWLAWQIKYSGGTGEPNNPYRIATAEDLNNIRNHIEDFNKCFVLVSDINMASFSYTTALIAPDINDSSGGFQGTSFTGIFDGNYCSISNLIIDTAGADNDFLGLFGRIEVPGQIKNLGVEDVNISGGDCSYLLGALCGENRGGSISNCYAAGSVSGSYYLGGLCGASFGSISNSYATGSITGDDDFGGLSGVNAGTISNCYATGSVTGGDDSYLLGGLCAANFGTISKCYATGPVTGGNGLGGLCGYNYDSIINCYSIGSVTGGDDSLQLGGLCGGIFSGTISNCYATGSVSGGDYSEMVGGLCGYNSRGTLRNCYETGSASGDSNVGGLVGYDDSGSYTYSFWNIEISPDVNGIGNISDPNVIGKTTAEMQTESTFTDAGWDFVGETLNGSEDIWTIHEAVDYPKLVWPLVNFIGWYEVDFLDYAFFANHWQDINCGDANDCDGADVDFSDSVDWADLKIFCDHWLEGASY